MTTTDWLSLPHPSPEDDLVGFADWSDAFAADDPMGFARWWHDDQDRKLAAWEEAHAGDEPGPPSQDRPVLGPWLRQLVDAAQAVNDTVYVMTDHGPLSDAVREESAGWGMAEWAGLETYVELGAGVSAEVAELFHQVGAGRLAVLRDAYNRVYNRSLPDDWDLLDDAGR